MSEQHLKFWRAVMLCATLAVMAVIFAFSAQPGPGSYALSEQITHQVQSGGAQTLLPTFFSEDLHANLRKWAHIVVFCALGICMAVTVHFFWGKGRANPPALRRQAVLAAVFCTGYAVTDELHQLFVPGRTGLLADVGVDAIGFLPCIVIVYLFLTLRNRRRKIS